MSTARWISLAFAAVFCALALVLQPTSMVFYAIAYMIIPLAAIWFGDELGSFSSGWQLNRPTPGMIVKLIGWVLLMITPLAVYAFRLRLELGF
jgi:hypothetical protein